MFHSLFRVAKIKFHHCSHS